MYIAGLEKIMKHGQELGLTGAELRNYFDTEREKLKAELALNREARRLGVDVALLKQSGESIEEIVRKCKQKRDEDESEALREYEKKKEAEEREIAALKQQIAVIESRLRHVTPDGVAENMTGSTPSHTTNPLVSPQSRTENRPSLAQTTICGLQECKQQEKVLVGDKCWILVKEARQLPLSSFCKAETSDFALPAGVSHDDSAEGSEKDMAQGSLVPEANLNNSREDSNTRGLPTGSERFLYSQMLSGKRKSRKKPGMHSATKTSVRAPLSRIRKQRECIGFFNERESRCFAKLNRRNKSHVMRQAERFLTGSSLHRSVRLGNLDAGPTSAIRAIQRSRTQGKTARQKHFRKRVKTRRKRRRKPHTCKKRDMFTTFQVSLFFTGLHDNKHPAKRRRKKRQGVFHSRGSCCPARKKRRML